MMISIYWIKWYNDVNFFFVFFINIITYLTYKNTYFWSDDTASRFNFNLSKCTYYTDVPKKYVHFDRLKLNLWSTVILQVLYVKLQCRAEHCNLHCNKGQQLCTSFCCFTVTLSYRHICCVKKCIITCSHKKKNYVTYTVLLVAIDKSSNTFPWINLFTI